MSNHILKARDSAKPVAGTPVDRLRVPRTILEALLQIAIMAAIFFAPWALVVRSLITTKLYYTLTVLNPSSYAMAIAVGLWLLLGGPGRTVFFSGARRLPLILCGVLIYWIMFSTRWAALPNEAVFVALEMTLAAGFAVVVGCVMIRPRVLVGALAAGVIVQSVVSLTQIALQRPVGLFDFGEFRVTIFNMLAWGTRPWMRPSGLTPNANLLSGYLVVALIIITSSWLTTESVLARWRAVVRTFVIVLGFWTLLVVFGRAAWLGALLGIVPVSVFLWRNGFLRAYRARFVRWAITVAVLLCIFVLSYWPLLLNRFGITTEFNESQSILGRVKLNSLGVEVLKQTDNPLLGVGIGMSWARLVEIDKAQGGDVQKSYGQVNHIHNVPLILLAELGFIGLGLWVAVWVAGAIGIMRTVRTPVGLGLAGAALATLLIGLLDHYFWTMPSFTALQWMCLMLSLNSPNFIPDAAETA